MSCNAKMVLKAGPILFASCCFASIAHAEYYCSIVGNIGFNFRDPPDRTTYAFIVKPGVPCPQKFGSGSTATFKDIIYQEDAKHGTVELRQSGAVYTARRDYHGKDSFTLRLCGNGRSGGYGCADIVYAITVE